MLKKMMLLAFSVAALVAFAVPAIAQANVQLTEEEKALEPGAEITATSTNLESTTGGGNVLRCAKVTFHFEVKVNGLEHVVLTTLNHTEATTEGCTVLIGGVGAFPVTITDPTIEHEVTINTWGTAITAAHFTADSPIGFNACPLGGNVHFQGTNGTDILHVEGSILTGNQAGCPPEVEIHGTFTTETEDGTPVILDSVTTE